MATESGYDNQKKYGPSQFKTIHNLGSDRYGTHVVSKSLTERFSTPVAIAAVAQSADGKSIRITKVAHGGQKGDIVRFSTGALLGAELEIIQVLDADNFVIRNVVGLPSVADTFKILYFITTKADSEGNMNFSPGPVKYVKDSVEVTATSDSVTPANNNPLPSEIFVDIDGVKQYVRLDTVTPSNSVGIPVELIGSSGPINITAGDLNVQLTDQGINADVTRIGDGTTQLAIVPVTGEAKVSDADALVELQSILAGIGAPADAKVADSSLSGSIIALLKGQMFYTEDFINFAYKVPGFYDATFFYDYELLLTGIDADTNNIFLGVGAPADAAVTNPASSASVIAALKGLLTINAAMSAKLPAALGQLAEAGSLSVALATEQDALLGNISTRSTNIEGILTTIDADTGSILTGIGAPADAAVTDSSLSASLIAAAKGTNSWLDDISFQLPAARGQTTKSGSLSVTLASDQENIGTEEEPGNGGTYATQTLNSATAQTLGAPAGAIGFVLSNDVESADSIRYRVGATATAAAGGGMALLPGASTAFIPCAANVSVIEVSGTCYANIQWVTRI